jgi:hypothetical protein
MCGPLRARLLCKRKQTIQQKNELFDAGKSVRKERGSGAKVSVQSVNESGESVKRFYGYLWPVKCPAMDS